MSNNDFQQQFSNSDGQPHNNQFRSKHRNPNYRQNQNRRHHNNNNQNSQRDNNRGANRQVNVETKALGPMRYGIPLWNFTVPHNISIRSSNLTQNGFSVKNVRLVDPEIELKRAADILLLRDQYETNCKELLNMKAPKESFNRWLFEQLSLPGAHNAADSLLRDTTTSMTYSSLKIELLSEIPARAKSVFTDEKQAAKEFQSYIKKMNQWLDFIKREKPQLAKELGFEVSRKAIEQTRVWLHHNQNSSLDILTQKLTDLREECVSYIQSAFAPEVDRVCDELAKSAAKSVENLTLFIQNRDTDRKFPVQVSQKTNDTVLVSYRHDEIPLRITHFQKLKTLYSIHCGAEDPSFEFFYSCLYILLRRYHTFFGPGQYEGNGFHAAAPEGVFEFMKKEYEVCQECFASPLNCYFARFCSAFPDTDVYFGSQGSFFDFEPDEGSFECGPPYTVEVMDKTADRLINILTKSDKPLSFIVFVPEWLDPPTNYSKILGTSKFNRFDFVAEAKEHDYVTGNQHIPDTSAPARYYLVPHGTHIYVMQNEAGYQKWTPTLEKQELLRRAVVQKYN